MRVDIQPVDRAALPALLALAQFYQYDFSEIEGGVTDLHGRFTYLDDLPERLSRPGASGWLFRVMDPHLHVKTLAGFAIVLGVADGVADRAIDEFFVMRKFRRLGIGRAAAHAVFRAAPGTWVAQGTRHNVGARAFWRRVIGEVAASPPEEAEDPTVTYPAWGFRFLVE